LYGTPRKPVEERIKNNQIVVLEIDLQGARQVKKSMPEAFLVMLKPPSIEELKRRLIDRGTEKPEELELRLQVAIGELEAENEFDAVVINEDVQSAVSQLITLLHLN
jgi:guanylate kinase